MFLPDKTIRDHLRSRKIIIDPPLDEKDVRPAGIRLHLDDKILFPKPNQTIDLRNPHALEYDEHFLRTAPYTIKPGEFLLASTKEKIQLDRSLIGFLDGRSTIARLGLTVYLSSMCIDGNYDEPRATTLEMKNEGNFSITLNYQDHVAMIVFAEMKENVEQPIQSQYRSQDGVTPPNVLFGKN